MGRKKKALAKRPSQDLSRTATQAYNDPRDASSPYIPLPEGVDGDDVLPDGWEAAEAWHRLKRTLPPGRERNLVRERAVQAVLKEAVRCVRHAARATVLEELSWPEAPEGELELEASLEQGLLEGESHPERLRVSRRVERRADVGLVLDMSLSMTGEKVALVAVAAAVLALRLPLEGLGLVAFDSTAHTLKPLGSDPGIKGLIRLVLEVPAKGYTNLEAGLRQGLRLLRPSRQARRVGVLLTDGQYNMGWNPAPLAALYPRLHVVQVGEGDKDRGLCRKLAELGRGTHLRAEGYAELPQVSLELSRELWR